VEPKAHPALADLGGRLRELAGDAAYTAGRDYMKKGLVKQGSVAGTKAYASVAGSTDYRVTIDFTADELKVVCTCPAHRRSKYCKHVVAVSCLLLEKPEQFSAVDPLPETPAAPKAAAKKSGTSRKKAPETVPMRAAGLETVDRLLAELTAGGLMALGPDKAALIAAAGELVRSLKLRRLGNLIMRLQRAQDLPADQFADLLVDLWLTRQAVGAHLDERVALDPQVAEDLLGKTWRDEELESVTGLQLFEIAYTNENDGEFQIETAYLAEVATGVVFADRLITPMKIGTSTKGRMRHLMLLDEGGLYPGAAPRRVKVRRMRRAPLTSEHVARFLEQTPTTVVELRRLLVERLGEPFGPPELPVLFRPAALVAQGDLVGALDRASQFVELSMPEKWRSELPGLLPEAGRYALFGLLEQAGRGLRLRCLSVISDVMQWGRGPVYPDQRPGR
jgi:hypothetical protein